MSAQNKNTPPNTLTNVPAAAPAERFTVSETKKGLEELRVEMMKPEKLGDIMKQFEKHKVNTGPWDDDPKSAIADVERYFPDGRNKRILLFALRSDLGSQEFEYGKKALSIITKHAAQQQLAIEKARLNLSKLSENSLNRVLKEGVTSIFEGVKRGDVTDQVIAGVTALVFLNHVFNKDAKNRLLRPLGFGLLGWTAFNTGILGVTDKAATDHLDKWGVPLQPSMRKQLPHQAQVIAKETGIDSTPTMFALGKLGEHKMSFIYSHYEQGKKKEFIDPGLFFGFNNNQIKGEELYKIVDTVVKKHEGRQIGGRLDGKGGSFKRDFVDKHDYDFLEVTSLLYQNEIQDVLNTRLSPEDRAEHEKKLKENTERMFQNTDAKPVLKNGMMEFYGVKFFTPPTPEKHFSLDDALVDAYHEYVSTGPVPEVVYSYKLGTGRVVTARMDDVTDKRLEQAAALKAYAMDFVKETVKKKAPNSPALKGTLVYGAPAYQGLEFQNVNLKGRNYTVRVSDEGDDKLVAVIQDGTPTGKRVTDWNKLEDAV